ncbi:hypothetical protein RO3G_03186 [Rhizopus delemar RA 99-880]|uniref:Uncharacterized protein n=1 Tax=Rhizopus delemar (strain RA 99-880 / ATCC MYA-4621 / FGSC 9543 / NRRL 43880) TaxID=246409 RepID=I1BQK2_RHIO9|nr:hypothetical protein RO3G_03186 [Rhizopus delemar RA 99-880]|eukprot:EIE78482.1 hypothetical protein RO3G_03186 [Rhizopus delemar RA 99-880]
MIVVNRKVLSNDELLYDPELDDEDEKWVNKQIEGKKKKKGNGVLETKDVRHEAYSNQYRAMFVQNCHVIKKERYQPKDGKEDEYYQKVVCDQCGVHVGMMDQDEVYHFFNVIPTA